MEILKFKCYFWGVFFALVSATWGQPPTREPVPHLAVFPLLSDQEHDYSVFMSERIIEELIFHRDIPAWQGRWFELVEPDSISQNQMRRLLEIKQAIQGEDLQVLRDATNAGHALVGYVSHTGTRTLHVRIIDLGSGESIWQGSARDDIKWQWIYKQQELGKIALGNLMSQLGFGEKDRRGRIVALREWPLRVVMTPLQTSQKALADVYGQLLRDEMVDNGLFDVVEIQRPIGVRIGSDGRMTLMKEAGADAVLCGSIMASGKDNAINTVGVALRLVALSSGRILWAGSANAQRVWRKDRFDDLTQSIASDLVLALAQVREGTRVDLWAGQPEPEDGAGWINRGMVALERGLLQQSEEAFLKAGKFPDSQVSSLEGLGRVYARRPAFRNRAVGYFFQALNRDSTRADLYYELAKVYFDIGTGQCVDLANRAVSLDPGYSLPYRLLGDWYARDNWYALPDDNVRAAKYYLQYLELEKGDVDVAVKLGPVLLRLEDQRTIEKQILPLLDSHPDAIALLPIAAVWAYRNASYELSADYWRRYLDRVEAQYKSLYIDPAPIMAGEIRQQYDEFANPYVQSFVDHFWSILDADPTTVVNERLLEHYQRVWIARAYFSSSAYPWDKRGQVFLRYGEPDYRSRSGRAPGVMSPAVQQVKERLYADLYDRPSENALVGTVFPVRSSRAMMAQETFGVRMSDGDTFTQGDAYLPVTSGEDHSLVPWESWVYVNIGGGIEITFTDEMGGGSFNFAPPPLRQPPGMRSISRIQENAPEARYARVVNEQPEQHRPWWQSRKFDFFYDVVDSKGDNGKTRVDVSFGLPHKDVGQTPVMLAVALYDSITGQTYRTSKKVSVRDGLSQDDVLLTDLLTLSVPSGFYRLAVKAENASANRVSMFRQTVEAEDYGVPALSISDPILAAQIGETEGADRFTRNGLRVIPMPTRAFLNGQDLGLYFEVYNLKPDGFGQMRFRVTIQITSLEQTEGLRQVFTGKEKRPEVAMTFEQVATESPVQVYQFVDMTEAKEGRSSLTVRVEDLNAHTQKTKDLVLRYGQ